MQRLMMMHLLRNACNNHNAEDRGSCILMPHINVHTGKYRIQERTSYDQKPMVCSAFFPSAEEGASAGSTEIWRESGLLQDDGGADRMREQSLPAQEGVTGERKDGEGSYKVSFSRN